MSPLSVEPPLLSVIVVSYNTKQMTLNCLHTLYDTLGELPAEVWVVDNASADGSPAAIRAAFPQARVIENDQNKGFGAANNLALRQSAGEFLLLLNSDAFVHPGAVAALLGYLRDHPNAGVVGPRLLNQDGSVQQSCYPYPSPKQAWLENFGIASLWPRSGERTGEWVIGACLLVRRAAYQQAGGFDEAFFMYQEETDWQRRIQEAGWEIAFTPAAQVTHLGGASGAAETARINAHFFDSLDCYIHKHYGLPGLISLRLAMILGCGLRTLLWGGIALIAPRRREIARAKARLQAWLCFRQATRWRGVGREARACS